MTNIKSKAWSFLKENKLHALFLTGLFILMCVLIYLCPLSGDDWDWGSKMGDDQLKNWFRDYNGRYAGNLIVIVLTRVPFLRITSIALTICALCLVPMLFFKRKSLLVAGLTALFILSMSWRMMVQGIFWTSGFVNYIPPILMTFAFFITARNLFEEESPSYSRRKTIIYSIFSFALGYISTMFMENITIYILIVSLFLALYSTIKFKRIYFHPYTHLLGSILGTICMFTNSAYGIILKGSDHYHRVSPLGQENLFDTALARIHSCVQYTLLECTTLLLSLTAICILATIVKVRGGNKREYVPLICCSSSITIITIYYTLCRFPKIWAVVLRITPNIAIVFGITALILCASVLTTLFIIVKDKTILFKMIFILAGFPILFGPMLFITPFGPRCTIPPYLCLVVFSVMFIEVIWEELSLSKLAKTIVSYVVIALSTCVLVYYIIVHIPMHKYKLMRLEYIEKQLDEGKTEIIVPNLPNMHLMQNGNVGHRYYHIGYKSYYNIPSNVKFIVLSPERFDAWVEEYEKGGNE